MKKDLYVATPNGSLLRYNHNSGHISMIINMMPSDANDPTRKNAEFSFEQNPVDTRRLLQMVSNLEILTKRTKER